MRAAGLAQLLRVPFDVDADDICPPPRTRPPIPWPRRGPASRGVRRDFDGEFDFGYAIGLAYALESSAHGWEQLDGAGVLEAVHEAAFTTVERQVG